MKVAILLIFVLLGVGFFVYTTIVQPMLNDRMVTTVVQMPVQNEALSFGFTYPSGEAGYTLIEPPISSTTTDVLDTYLIMSTADYLAFQASDEAREAPPAMLLFVASAPTSEAVTGGRIARLQQWAMDNPQYTSFDTKTSEVEVVEVDGAQAIRYDATGLYEQKVYVVFYDGNVYSFVGQYRELNDGLSRDFENLMTSVSFY